MGYFTENVCDAIRAGHIRYDESWMNYVAYHKLHGIFDRNMAFKLLIEYENIYDSIIRGDQKYAKCPSRMMTDIEE